MASASNLRWPGAKTRAVQQILEHFPQNVNEVASIFLGGGSVELALCDRGVKVSAYDRCSYLINYWQVLLRSPERLANRMESLFLPKMQAMERQFFYRLQKGINVIDDPWDRAGCFFTLNRASFSGTTLAGGMSPGFERLNENCIERLRQFSCTNLRVQCQDFRLSIPANSGKFLFLDPPYVLPRGKNNLYGVKGRSHKLFNHLALARLLKSRPNGGFILCYNDCEFIRDLYKEYRQIPLKWAYGMGKIKESSEILIIA
ncbi:MAG: DNA adenine methylase [Desulfomonilaceae bacterium]